jgi:hypothetical protein
MPTARTIDRRTFLAHTAALTVAGLGAQRLLAGPEPLAGTTRLEWDFDLAARMVDGLHAFLDETRAQQHSETVAVLTDFSFVGQSREKERRRLAQIIGAVDPRSLPTVEYSVRRGSPDRAETPDRRSPVVPGDLRSSWWVGSGGRAATGVSTLTEPLVVIAFGFSVSHVAA